jgi:hypothetical protein
LDVYVVNREFWPLSKMEKLFYIELPIEKEQRRSVATNKLNDMIKKLNHLNMNIKYNLRTIKYLNSWAEKNNFNKSNKNYLFIKSINSP